MAVSEHSDSEVAGASAIAFRLEAAGSGDALIRNQHVAQLSAESVLALHHIAIEDHAAALPVPMTARNRSLAAVGAEDGVVSPERRRVGVVQIGHRFAEFVGQALANIEPGPTGMDEVCGARALSWPAALAGPGVSRPTATTSSRRTPTFRRRVSRPSAICCRQMSGPCLAKAGCSNSPSMRNFSCWFSNV